MHQVVAIVIGFDLNPRQHPAGLRVVEFRDLRLDRFHGGYGLVSAAQQDDALNLVIFIAPGPVPVLFRDVMHSRCVLHLGRLAQADAAEASLVTDNDPLLPYRITGRERTALDNVVDLDRPVVYRGDHDLPDLVDAALLFLPEPGSRLRRILHAQHLFHRIESAAIESHAAHVEDDVPWTIRSCAHVLVAITQRRLQLRQRYPVTFEPVGSGWIS